MIQVIQSIQNAKKALLAPEQPSAAERMGRLKILLAAAEKLFENLEYEFEKRASLCAVQNAISELESEVANSRPTGLIVILLPTVLPWQTLFERLAPALAAGNAVIVKPSSRETKVFEWLSALTELAPWLQVVQGTGEEVGSILTQHPAVRGVSVACRTGVAEKILKSGTLGQKKWQISKPAHNSAVFMDAIPTSAQVDLLLRACTEGGGSTPWNITNIFVSEKGELELHRLLKERMLDLKWKPDLDFGILQMQKQVLIADQGREIISAESGAAFFKDVSHCSVLQQDEMQAPLFLVSTYKYIHEAAKWANVGYLNQICLLIGDVAKAERFQLKLDFGKILINCWPGQWQGPLVGAQQSFFGIPDFRTFGDFYSDRRKVDSSPSVS